MYEEKNPYTHVYDQLSGLGVKIKQWTANPAQGPSMDQAIQGILQAAERAGGKLHADVVRLASAMQRFQKCPTDPLIVQQMLDHILQIRQDATEL